MKAFILAIIVIVYLYRLLLHLLRGRSVHRPVPANVADVYDQATYQKWQAYHSEKNRLAIITDTVTLALELGLIVFGAYPAFARLFPAAPFWQMTSVFVLLSAASTLVMLPFSWHDTMGIEQKYGFNRTDRKTFWLDQLKEFLISLIVMIAIGALLMWLHHLLGDLIILAFAVVMTLLLLVITFLYPFLSRIFNHFTPLEDGDLKQKLTAMLEKHGYKVRAIQVMDASKRSSKSNAYFTGFGKMKTIVLYDTLVASMTPDEICAVFAHEMGHGLHKDTLKNQILSFVQMLLLGTLAYFFLRMPNACQDFGFDSLNYGFVIAVLIMNVFSLIAPLYGLLTSNVSRRAEYRADAQAVSEGYADELVTALKKLSRENFADLSPDPLLVALEYSHPTLSQRIDAIDRQKQGDRA
ncbi:MAG: M48 family metallopeptidase [Clostridia bacterium]|nr:M48 family metallopeptidase [Clostridia bacterium]